MFTGIIEEIGRIEAIEELGGGRRLTVSARMSPELRVDESVAVNGACQTVVRTGEGSFDVVAVEETLRKTTFGELAVGDAVNLERAMRPNGRLDGHIVLGHVDATGTVEAVEPEQTNRLYHIRFEPAFAPYLIPVGSVAVDGISLTVARLEGDRFTVAIIPHTAEKTTVSSWAPGRRVNLEFDMIGKYVVRWMSVRGTPPPPGSPPLPGAGLD